MKRPEEKFRTVLRSFILLKNAESLEEWRDEIIYSENAELSELSEEVQDKVCELILRERIKRFNQPEEYLTQWEEFCKRRVLE